MNSSTKRAVNRLIAAQGLPDGYATQVSRYFLPLSRAIDAQLQRKPRLLIGLQGAQGSGKSTCADFIACLLEHQFEHTVGVVSLDDFYLTQKQRSALAQNVHPLLQTRGVPGTHDVVQIEQVLHAFANGEALQLPRFDKATDNPLCEDAWPRLNPAPRVLIFEGWCMGIEPQCDADLAAPVNALEQTEDPQGVWRRYVNAQIEQRYMRIYSELDLLIVLQAPNFSCVYQWRAKQEQKLIERLHQDGRSVSAAQNPDQLRHFIQHFQRLTEHGFKRLPARADFVLSLTPAHQISKLAPWP